MSAGRVRAFKKLGISEEDSKFQDNVNETFGSILGSQILDGVLLTDIELTTGVSNNIEHKLGREIIGYIIVKKNANSIIWDSQDTNKLSNLTLVLNCSANVKISLWIF